MCEEDNLKIIKEINNCDNVDEIESLYIYSNTGTEDNPVMTRPLGEFPVL